jgi:hypothetical protein
MLKLIFVIAVVIVQGSSELRRPMDSVIKQASVGVVKRALKRAVERVTQEVVK